MKVDTRASSARTCGTALLCTLMTAVVCVAAPGVASAQLSRIGSSQDVLVPVYLLGDTGAGIDYDPINDVYFAAGAGGTVIGAFLDNTGGVKAGTSQFRIGSAGQCNPICGAVARVKYSPDLNNGQGGFLVTWHQNDSGVTNFVHAVVVAYPTGVISPDRVISDAGTNFLNSAAIGYSPTSRRFLVAWNGISGGILKARFVDLTGTAVGSVFTVEGRATGVGGVAWNAATDEFGVCASAFQEEDGREIGAYISFRRVAASSGALSARLKFGYTLGTFDSDCLVNPATKHFVVGWNWQGAGYTGGGRYAEIDEAGTLLGTGSASEFRFLAMSLNTTSGTILWAGGGNSWDILGRELDGAGVARGSEMELTDGGTPRADGTKGSFGPRIAAKPSSKEWAVLYVRGYVRGRSQIIRSAAALGGPVTTVQMTVDSPSPGSLYKVTDTIPMSGWVVDRGTTTGTGVDALHVYAFPSAGGPPVFLSSVTSFTSRADVGGLLGAQFANSGFSTSASGLAPGTYTFNFYAHSTVTNAYGTPKSVTVTITPALPLMGLDSPANGATVATGGFTIIGWALDKYALSGSGVDAVHVWAFQTGNTPTFVGQATVGAARPDIAAVFGAQFAASGFTLTGTLPAGNYQLVAYMHDTLSGTFNLSASANIKVGALPAAPLMSVDAPAAGNVALGSIVSGWAIDRGAGVGPGVDAVHVYAAPVGGGAPVEVGAATLGLSRPDIGAAFGAQFTNSGFSIPLLGVTKGQQYDLTVYARSTVTGTFNQLKTVRITIQ